MSDFSEDDGLDEYLGSLSNDAFDELVDSSTGPSQQKQQQRATPSASRKQNASSYAKPSTSSSQTTRVTTSNNSSQLPRSSPVHGRQTTLTGNYNTGASNGAWEYTPSPKRGTDDITPTHHDLDPDALSIYIYPANLEPREYQMNIVKRALFENVLCALPTGLGKTFIASTVMLNYYRWTKTGKIIFMAPTRPLVSQQLEACLGITGIPRSDSSILIGGALTPVMREDEWANKRVFFATPQTVDNDLKKGIVDPKSIACLVIDEAHRATGNQAYVEVVKFIKRFNNSFRILALTATPSTTLEGVQAVISNLNISRVEIRTEDSPDIKQYVHKKQVVRLVSSLSDDQHAVLTLFCAALKPLLNNIAGANVLHISDPVHLNQFVAVSAMKTLMGSTSKSPAMFKYLAILKVLASMGHAMNLLKYHGIRPFYNYLKTFENEASTGSKGGKSKQPGKHASTLFNSAPYRDCICQCESFIFTSGVVNQKFMGHPKLQELAQITKEFFSDTKNIDSKAIIFSAYRDSGVEILRVIEANVPECKAHLFIGQAAGKGSDNAGGMSQKEQQRVVQQFKAGQINTLIATSIGEEGLDIGEVDLIICYDASSSPIRMLQRIGRTGRKRAGKIYMLLTDNEEKKLDKSFDNYKYIQNLIQNQLNDDSQQLEYSPRHRILPPDVQPECVQMMIEIPEENRELLAAEDIVREAELTQKKTKRAGGKRKAAKKTFNMPDNVKTGFVKASKCESPKLVDLTGSLHSSDDEKPWFIPSPKTKPVAQKSTKPVVSRKGSLQPFIKPKDNDKIYYYDPKRDGLDYGIYAEETSPESSLTVTLPASTTKVPQPRSSRRFTNLINKIHSTTESTVEELKRNFHPEDCADTTTENTKNAPKPRTVKRMSNVVLLSSSESDSEGEVVANKRRKMNNNSNKMIEDETDHNALMMLFSSDDE